jgi:hypothetical protein
MTMSSEDDLGGDFLGPPKLGLSDRRRRNRRTLSRREARAAGIRLGGCVVSSLVSWARCLPFQLAYGA